MARLRNRLHSLRHDESGIVLILAIVIMSVLTIVLATTIAFTSASGRHSGTSNAGQKALALAEAGVNNATSTLFNMADPSTGPASSCGSATGETWCYQRAGSTLGTMVWTLTGTGTVSNPAVTGGNVTRTVTHQYRLGTSPLWQWNYSDAPPGSCMNVSNNVTIGQPLFVRGDLCIGNNAHFMGSALQVGGKLNINNNGSAGTAASPILEAKLAGCGSDSHACTTADSVYANPPISRTIDNLTKPPVDLAGWYTNAQPGPMHPCTSGTGITGGFDTDTTFNTNRASFTLTPGTSYSCIVTSGSATVGQLIWNASTGVLQVAGTIFFDGPILVTAAATYTGSGTIYAAGAITFANNAQLCGVAACDATWDPGTNLLVLVAGAATGIGFQMLNNAVFQGASYVVSDYSAANNSINWGPVIAHQLDIKNNTGFKAVTTVPPGAPGANTTLQEVPGSWTG
jgi:hypothetical protein